MLPHNARLKQMLYGSTASVFPSKSVLQHYNDFYVNLNKYADDILFYLTFSNKFHK